MLVITCPTCQFRFGIPDRVPAERLKCPLCAKRLPPLSPEETVRVDTGTQVTSAPDSPSPSNLDFTESDQTFFNRVRLVSALGAIRDWLLVPAVLATILALAPMFTAILRAETAAIPGSDPSWDVLRGPLLLIGGLAIGYYLPPILILIALYRLRQQRSHGFVSFGAVVAILLMAGMLVHALIAAVVVTRRMWQPNTAGDYFETMFIASNWVTVVWIPLALAVGIIGIIGAVRAFQLLRRPDVKAAFH
jgi:hypothetical protein